MRKYHGFDSVKLPKYQYKTQTHYFNPKKGNG